MFSNPFFSGLYLHVIVTVGVALAVPSPIAARADSLSACAASMNGVLPSPTPADFEYSGTVRKYYVAAEETEWNYAPTGWDNWLGVPLADSPRAQMSGATAYGTTWLKALYRGYTDATFTQRSPVPAWQGTLGPTLRSEVGDMIEIMFVNRLTSNYATMHSMGLAYTKLSEGADYPNNTAPGQSSNLPESNAVPPGGCVVYKWMVDDIAGPPAGQPAVAHSYHSYVSYQQDSDAGLLGPQMVYASGQMASTIAEYREFPLLYMIYNEADSWLSAKNAAALQSKGKGWNGDGSSGSGTYGGQNGGYATPNSNSLAQGNYSIWHPQLVNLGGAYQFQGAPSFFTMNGYIFANNPTFQMCTNDKVIWYLLAFGSASHVFHMHGNSFTYNGNGMASIGINDGELRTLYMDATGQGKWQVICHVAYHQALGMVSNYQVYPTGSCPLPPLS